MNKNLGNMQILARVDRNSEYLNKYILQIQGPVYIDYGMNFQPPNIKTLLT